MTGRYTLTATGADIAAHFRAVAPNAELALHIPRYNVAPLQTMPIVRLGAAGGEIVLAHWGLIPAWAKDRAIASHLINARAESVAVKPAFRVALKRRRCLVPADGYYEWKTLGSGHETRKQPYLIALKNGGLFAFAGLWERWHAPTGETIDSYTILTTEAHAALRPLHDRMPVVVPPPHYARWIGAARDPAYLLTLIEPAPADLLRATPVSTVVNNATHDAPDCIAPMTPP